MVAVRRVVLITLTSLIWGLLILNSSDNHSHQPSPVLTGAVLLGISLAVYSLIRRRRCAVEMSTLIAGCTVMAALLSAVAWNRVVDILEQRGMW
jgi:hypothetical protein